MFDLASEITVNVVPEPGTLLLMASGLLGLVLWGRRKRALIETA
ncbi:MAG: PEP-CTERM sorting domain-containing protein [Nitrospirae bacterium]|nr:PEP-CTERM sorting domain-containing protein [Nitrospirota bacterium]